jgi:hypothetical protein
LYIFVGLTGVHLARVSRLVQIIGLPGLERHSMQHTACVIKQIHTRKMQ